MKQNLCKGGCGKYPMLGFAGFCFMCAPMEIRESKLEKVKEQRKKSSQKQREKVKVRSLISSQDNDAAKRQRDLNKWFEYVGTVIAADPKCWNCGEYISKSDYRNSSAHILFKKIFPSVATHPLNFLVLGCRCGCHEKSHTIEFFKKMPVWKLAVLRFTAFEKDIVEKHKILDLFRNAIKETI